MGAKFAFSALFALAAIIFPTTVWAVTFNDNDHGWYNSSGGHDTTNDNILTGLNLYHNFFVFDLSAAAGKTVTSAKLIIPGRYGNYISPTNETYAVFDYSGSIADLVAGSGAGNSAGSPAGVLRYTDLGGGNSYGQMDIQVPFSGQNNMPQVTITFNSSGIADLNSLLAGIDFAFAVGGNCTTCSSSEYLWGTSAFIPSAQLELEFSAQTPLPAALPLFASGLGALGLLGWRRKRKNVAALAA